MDCKRGTDAAQYVNKFQPKRRCSAALTKHVGCSQGKLGGDLTLSQASLEAFFSPTAGSRRGQEKDEGA